MTEVEKINKWKIPKWHKDYGDPKKEVKLLQDICLFILSLGFKYCFEIEYVEEGYLGVNIFKNKVYFGSIQVVDIEDNKVGLFTENGEEFYINHKEEIKKYL